MLLGVLAENLQVVAQLSYRGWIWYQSAAELRGLTSPCYK